MDTAMPRKKRKQNQAEKGAWGENKERVAIMLTPTAIEVLDARAKALSLSRSEFLERIVRGKAGMSSEQLLPGEVEKLGESSGSPLRNTA